MKHNASKRTPKSVAVKETNQVVQATDKHAAAPDPKEQLRTLREQSRQIRQQLKETQQTRVIARSEERIEIVDRWIKIYEERRANALRRIEKIDGLLETLNARREKLQVAKTQIAA